MTNEFSDLDVMIIGGGPGGLSAALWCAELGLRAVLFEKEAEFGGQLLWTFNAIKNYLGIEAANGRELRDRFLKHVENKNVKLVSQMPVVNANLAQKTVTLASGLEVSAKAIIIATGVRRRQLGIPGEVEFQGRGILNSGVQSKNEVAGKTVLIVGGGDAAVENALILSEVAEQVIILHRREVFTARKDFVAEARLRENIKFITGHLAKSIKGTSSVESIDLENIETRGESEIPVDAVLLRVGVIPNTEICQKQILLDGKGYLIIDSKAKTGMNRVYAVGDVTNHFSPTISDAAGQGATAAQSIAIILGLKL